MNETIARIKDAMNETRDETLQLFQLAPESALHVSPGFGFRPIIWHLAHIGVFEAFWILQNVKGDTVKSAKYQAVFDPIKTPRASSTDLPSREEMKSFLSDVRDDVFEFMETLNKRNGDALNQDSTRALLEDNYVFDLVLEHERQHQETLAYLFKMLDASQKRKPDAEQVSPVKDVSHTQEMIEIAAGETLIGANENCFAYDNERPAQVVEVAAFRLDKLLTTNGDYLRFIEEQGYARSDWWTPEGWAWREKEAIEHPLYWNKTPDGWRIKTMFDDRGELPLNHPVTGVSFYEAEAFARFTGKRLPTEFEWEKAASLKSPDSSTSYKSRFAWGDDAPSLKHCNFGGKLWGTSAVGAFPRGATSTGVLDMTGNVWEWTSSSFAPYPNFAAFPYPEYSQEWFDGDHRVLRGGSWATRPSLLRNTFRNFFRRNFRIAFAGIRCASDA